MSTNPKTKRLVLHFINDPQYGVRRFSSAHVETCTVHVHNSSALRNPGLRPGVGLRRHRRSSRGTCCNTKKLMLTPKTIREVERCLLLVAQGRAKVSFPAAPAAVSARGPVSWYTTDRKSFVRVSARYDADFLLVMGQQLALHRAVVANLTFNAASGNFLATVEVRSFFDEPLAPNKLRLLVSSFLTALQAKENRADASQELWAVSKTTRSLRLLTRFVESGHEVIAAHVLTMLGGPMEQMESWGPPGSNKRRPCKVTVSNHGKAPLYTAHLGSPENWHATD